MRSGRRAPSGKDRVKLEIETIETQHDHSPARSHSPCPFLSATNEAGYSAFRRLPRLELSCGCSDLFTGAAPHPKKPFAGHLPQNHTHSRVGLSPTLLRIALGLYSRRFVPLQPRATVPSQQEAEQHLYRSPVGHSGPSIERTHQAHPFRKPQHPCSALRLIQIDVASSLSDFKSLLPASFVARTGSRDQTGYSVSQAST